MIENSFFCFKNYTLTFRPPLVIKETKETINK